MLLIAFRFLQLTLIKVSQQYVFLQVSAKNENFK